MTNLIVAATACDAQIGINLFNNYNLSATGIFVASTQKEQNELQRNKELLTKQTLQTILRVTNINLINTIVIYCNSMSFALDLDYISCNLRENGISATILSTKSIYDQFFKENKFAVIAVSNQALYHIESYFLNNDSESQVIGLSALDMVNDIELGMSPSKIIQKHNLVEQVNIFKNKDCKKILLGCTHFAHFYVDLMKELSSNNISIDVFDIAHELKDAAIQTTITSK